MAFAWCFLCKEKIQLPITGKGVIELTNGSAGPEKDCSCPAVFIHTACWNNPDYASGHVEVMAQGYVVKSDNTMGLKELEAELEKYPEVDKEKLKETAEDLIKEINDWVDKVIEYKKETQDRYLKYKQILMVQDERNVDCETAALHEYNLAQLKLLAALNRHSSASLAHQAVCLVIKGDIESANKGKKLSEMYADVAVELESMLAELSKLDKK